MSKRRYKFTFSERKDASCEQYWLLRWGLRLRSMRRGIRAVIGDSFGSGLDAWWVPDGDDVVPRLDAARDAAAIVMKAEERNLMESQRFTMATPYQQQFTMDQLEDARKLVMVMLEGYDATYGGSTLQLVKDLRVEAVEGWLEAATRTDKGTQGWAWYGGYIDKLVVDEHGQVWILDHKTTGKDLDTFLAHHQYEPQMAGYAWLVWRVLGVQPVGVIYDVAKQDVPVQWQDIPVTKKGDRFYARNRLPTSRMTAEVWLQAIQHNGFTFDDQPWYRELLEELRGKGNPFFRRERVRFMPGDLERVERELYTEGGRLRRLKQLLGNMPEFLDGVFDRDGEMNWKTAVVQVLQQYGELFPRNGAMCWKWNRPCQFMDVCKLRSVEGLEGMLPAREVKRRQQEENGEEENEAG